MFSAFHRSLRISIDYFGHDFAPPTLDGEFFHFGIIFSLSRRYWRPLLHKHLNAWARVWSGGGACRLSASLSGSVWTFLPEPGSAVDNRSVDSGKANCTGSSNNGSGITAGAVWCLPARSIRHTCFLVTVTPNPAQFSRRASYQQIGRWKGTGTDGCGFDDLWNTSSLTWLDPEIALRW